MPKQEKYSQATNRSFRVFRDQHGRRWGGSVENKTQAPCGPLSIQSRPPLVARPPVLPPTKYLRVTDAAAGELVVQYDRWLEDLAAAWEEHNQFVFAQATDLYKDQAAKMVDEMPPALIRRVGRTEPLRREVVLAMRAEDPWILGLSTERPNWADSVMPETQEVDELAFMREGKEEKPDPLAEYRALQARAAELGLEVEGTGKNGAITKDNLKAAIAKAETEQPAGVSGGVDPSWQE